MNLLHHAADRRSVAFAVLAVAVPLVQWTGALRHPALYAAGLVLAFLACVVNHNHQHHPTFRSAPLDRLFGALLTAAVGQPASAIIPLHNVVHHGRNNAPDDFVRASLVRFRWNLLNLLVFPFAAIRGYWNEKSRSIRDWQTAHPGRHRQFRFERIVLAAYLAPLLLAGPAETLIYVALPWAFGQWGILAINLVQHDGCDPRSEYGHSRDFAGRFLNWWVLNNGYHTAHHLRPGLHWSLLPAAHARIRDRVAPGLEEASFAGALARMYLWPGRRPGPPVGCGGLSA